MANSAYGVKSFTIDYDSDISWLPTNVKVGSTAISRDSGNVYILGNDKKWALLGSSGGSGGGSSESDWEPFDSDSGVSQGSSGWEPMGG